MKRLFIVFFFISAGLFGEETGLQVGNAGEGGGTFTFYDVVFGSGMIGILIWGLLFATSTAALAITIRAIWSMRKSRFISAGFTEQILSLVESKNYQEAYNACVGSPAPAKKIVMLHFAFYLKNNIFYKKYCLGLDKRQKMRIIDSID